MRLLVLALVVAAVLSSTGVAATSHSRVRLLGLSPLVVRGTGFKTQERVIVTVHAGPLVRTGAVSSSRAGGFLMRFTEPLPRVRCGTLTVTAVGSRGDKASWVSPARMCGGGPLLP